MSHWHVWLQNDKNVVPSWPWFFPIGHHCCWDGKVSHLQVWHHPTATLCGGRRYKTTQLGVFFVFLHVLTVTCPIYILTTNYNGHVLVIMKKYTVMKRALLHRHRDKLDACIGRKRNSTRFSITKFGAVWLMQIPSSCSKMVMLNRKRHL